AAEETAYETAPARTKDVDRPGMHLGRGAGTARRAAPAGHPPVDRLSAAVPAVDPARPVELVRPLGIAADWRNGRSAACPANETETSWGDGVRDCSRDHPCRADPPGDHQRGDARGGAAAAVDGLHAAPGSGAAQRPARGPD